MLDKNKSKEQLVDELQTLRFQYNEIKDFKNVRQQLIDQLHFQGQLLKNVRDSVVATDLEGNVIYWNQGATLLYGYSQNEVIGKNITFIVEPQNQEEEHRRMLHVMKKGTWNGQYRQRKKNGKIFWADTTISLIKDENEKPIGFIGIDRDITQQKQTEKELRTYKNYLETLVTKRTFQLEEELNERKRIEKSLVESETKYRMLAENSSDMVLMFRNYNLEYVNPAVENILGYNRDEFLSLDLFSLLHPDDVTQIQNVISDRIENMDNHPFLYQYRMNSYDGAYCWLESIGVSKVLPDGDVISILNTRDITKRIEMETKLRCALEDKETLLNEVHHRVKNNLQIISSLLDLQLINTKDEQLCGLLEDSIGRIKSMAGIHKLLYETESFAQLNFEKYLQRISADIIAFFSQKAKNVNINVSAPQIFLNLEKAVPCALIVNELVSNALKHGFPDSRKGQISIEMFHKDEHYCMVVYNNGEPFPDSMDLNKIKTLGLTLVKNLVKQLDGSFEYELENGVKFIIIFK